MILRGATTSFVLVGILGVALSCLRHAEGMSPGRRAFNVVLAASQMPLAGLLLVSATVYEWPDWMFATLATIGALSIVLEAVLVRGLRLAEKREGERMRVQVLEEQVLLQERHYERISQDLAEARAMRASLVRDLNRTKTMLRTDKETALAQLTKAVGTLDASMNLLCDHPVVDALMFVKAKACEEAGIAFSCDLQIPYDVAVSGVELCAVLSNIVDNAVRACSEMPLGERTFSLKAFVAKGFLVVVGVNACASSAARPAISDRGYGEGREGLGLSDHGRGLVILESVAARRHGRLRAVRKGGEFRVTVTLGLDADPIAARGSIYGVSSTPTASLSS